MTKTSARFKLHDNIWDWLDALGKLMITQANIDEKLSFAQTNGYWLDDTLDEESVDQIVADLQECDVDCEEIDHDVLEPLVQDWYDRHNPEVCR